MENFTFMNTTNLTMEDTKALSAYLIKNCRTERLSDEQERDLILQIHNGDSEALEELLKANICFVVYAARLYKHNGLDMHEMIAAGIRGLVQAANKYDPSKGFRFSHYAIWWIRIGIIDAIINRK